jgi:hypothetical protein
LRTSHSIWNDVNKLPEDCEYEKKAEEKRKKKERKKKEKRKLRDCLQIKKDQRKKKKKKESWLRKYVGAR